MGRLSRAAALASLCAASCSLVSPSEDSLERKDDCPPGAKRCSGQCVGTDQPVTGCGSLSCDPCALAGAEAICVAGACRVGACAPGRGDCDGAPANGCETTLATDLEHCGTCGHSCTLSGTLSECASGKCVVAGCTAGHADCNGTALDGCEVDVQSDPQNCGACGAACSLPSAVPACSDGACGVGACVTGRGNCDGKVLNGCEADLASDPEHCGACAAPCAPNHGKGTCSVGVCELTGCDTGWADCDGMASNGCEVDLANSSASCGSCGAAVATGQVCRSGVPTANDPALLAWLDQQDGGWCNDQFTKFMNLCGTKSLCPWDSGTEYPGGVMFCCDPKLMKLYPEGLAFDVGFHWDGVSGGVILDAGGDCDQKRVGCNIEKGPKLVCRGPMTATAISMQLTLPGRMLVSYRVSATAGELWVNGVLVGTSTGSGTAPELITKCGPGFNLGQRISYWWEGAPPGAWLRFAPFFFHLKDKMPAAGSWSLTETVQKTSRSVMLFDSTQVSGDAWTDLVSGQVGLVCGGKAEAEKQGAAPVPCGGKRWVADVAAGCL